MKHLSALLLVMGLAVLGYSQDEKKKPDEKKPAEPTTKMDWSAWVDHGKLVGEVTKIEKDGSFILTQKVQQMQPGLPGRQPKTTTKTTKQQMTFAEGGLLRYKELPTRVDEKGKRLPYTAAEQRELRLPTGAPGYAAEKSVLTAGTVVEVTLVRPKSVKVNELQSQDLRVKWAIIMSQPAPVEKLPTEKKDAKKDEKKKP